MIGDFRIIAKSDGTDLYTHSEAVRDTANIFNIKGNFGIPKRVIRYASIWHDVGKANPLFLENMRAQNFDNVMRHEIASILFVDSFPEDIRDEVALTILSHHKSIMGDARSIVDIYNDMGEKKLYNNHIADIEIWGLKVKNYMEFHYDIDVNIPSKERCVEILNYYIEKINTLPRGYALDKGLLMMADHFASCFSDDKERLTHINTLFQIPNTSSFRNKDERYPLSLVNKDNNKKHSLCIAPTGCGKTNFVINQCEGKRIFYTLPYQASINAMYNRINEMVTDGSLIGLKHSSLSSLNFVEDHVKTLSTFYGASIKVITPFQILETILRLKGYESTILDIKGNAVIFDELHTYNTMTHHYIIEMIKFLISLDCSIHICTATMPSYMRDEIIDVLGIENVQLVTLTDTQLESYNRHIVHTVDSFDLSQIIKEYIDGNKVLVVRNTVKESIKTYEMLKEALGECKIMLLHSRFRRCDRAKLETKLMEEFNGKLEPCILISTQVVEVSIDINFDVLFTDCADIMALIQRFGRINRQRKNIGVHKHIYIIKLNDVNYEHYPYDEDICNKTFDTFKKIDGRILEEKALQSLIDSVHQKPTDEKYENAKPYNANGEWKNKMYEHAVGTCIANELKFEGYIAVLDSDYNEYEKGVENKERFEIPIPYERKGLKPITKGDKTIGFIVPSRFYDFEKGLTF